MTTVVGPKERKRGGLAPRRKGDAVECLVVADQERIGRVAFRVRQGGGEPVDVVVICSGKWPETWFVQVKATSPYLAPAEKEALVYKAKSCGAIPMVAWKSPTSKKLEYKAL